MRTIDDIHGQFVTLRILRKDDAERTFRWRQTDRASLINRGARNVQEQEAWIAARPDSEYNFVIEVKGKGPVGTLSLVGIDEVHRHAESGRFLIGEPDLVRGVPAAVEAMKLLYELAFDRLKLVRVHGTVGSDNTLMIKWQKYLGMKEEGRLRSHYFLNGQFQDAVCLGILEDEYRRVAEPKMRALIAAVGGGAR